jgi:DNA-binding response OmpR family regulator
MQVITLPGGDSIVETAAAGSFDAILLDVVMPRIDGPHCLELLRADERTKGLPVIFLTARGSREDRASLGEENGIQTLAKPFDPISLADTLRGLLGQ